MTATPTPAPPASPERPDLATVETKADVLVRLRDWADPKSTFPDCEDEAAFGRRFFGDMNDAITTIQALREMNQRHCDDERLLKEARARVAELEAGRG